MNRTAPVAVKQALGEEHESRLRRRRLPPSPHRRAEMDKMSILSHSVSTATQHGIAQARLPALTRLAHSRRFRVLEKKSRPMRLHSASTVARQYTSPDAALYCSAQGYRVPLYFCITQALTRHARAHKQVRACAAGLRRLLA